VTDVLARRDRALTPEETEELLRDRLGDGVLRSVLEFGVFTVWIAQDHWVAAARACRDEPLLAYDMFDNAFGVDAREEGFDYVAILYSTSTGNRLALRTRCDGGREAPVCPSMVEIYRGADWMERETWDMFGIDFPGHPSVSPRILTVENFEGWPLRKDFHLVSRAAKPWPGVAEPKELDDDGNIIEREKRIGDAPGPYELDKVMGEQAKLANPLPDPPAVTEEGVEVTEGAATAAVAEDSGKVLAGEQERGLEEQQKLRSDAEVEIAGDEAEREPTVGEQASDVANQGEPASGAVDTGEPASKKADDRRKAQAEARARKAAERASADEAPGDDPAASDDPEGSA
jgi:NADH:ubiquinone oxidoreductase subunit C